MIKPNDSAFPSVDSFGYRKGEGLTKREYFAAMAMQAILTANPADTPYAPANDAHWAVRYADALIAELEETND